MGKRMRILFLAFCSVAGPLAAKSGPINEAELLNMPLGVFVDEVGDSVSFFVLLDEENHTNGVVTDVSVGGIDADGKGVFQAMVGESRDLSRVMGMPCLWFQVRRDLLTMSNLKLRVAVPNGAVEAYWVPLDVLLRVYKGISVTRFDRDLLVNYYDIENPPRKTRKEAGEWLRELRGRAKERLCNGTARNAAGGELEVPSGEVRPLGAGDSGR